jgi:hypothetical protein
LYRQPNCPTVCLGFIELNNQALPHPRGRGKEVGDMMMIIMMVVILVQQGEFSFTQSGRQRLPI